MTDAVPELVPCRLCAEPVARDATRCSSCGATPAWVPDEPAMNPRVLRLAMWGGGVVVLGLLLLVASLMLFGPRAEKDEDERDHRPPAVTQPSR